MSTEKYVLKPGFSHYHRQDNRVVELSAGDVADLTPTQAEAFADRFELLSAVEARAEVESKIAASAKAQAAEQEATKPAPGTAGDGAPVKPAPSTPEPAENVGDYKAGDLIKMIGKCKTADEVAAIADAEEARSRPRSTVLAAADERLEELD